MRGVRPLHAYNGEPLRHQTRLSVVGFTVGGPRVLYLPMDDIPALPITGVEVMTSTGLSRVPGSGAAVATPPELAELTLTLVDTANTEVISDLPLGSISYNPTSPAPAGFILRRKVFRVHNVDPSRSFVRYTPTGAVNVLNVVLQFSFGP